MESRWPLSSLQQVQPSSGLRLTRLLANQLVLSPTSQPCRLTTPWKKGSSICPAGNYSQRPTVSPNGLRERHSWNRRGSCRSSILYRRIRQNRFCMMNSAIFFIGTHLSKDKVFVYRTPRSPQHGTAGSLFSNGSLASSRARTFTKFFFQSFFRRAVFRRPEKIPKAYWWSRHGLRGWEDIFPQQCLTSPQRTKQLPGQNTSLGAGLQIQRLRVVRV